MSDSKETLKDKLRELNELYEQGLIDKDDWNKRKEPIVDALTGTKASTASTYFNFDQYANDPEVVNKAVRYFPARLTLIRNEEQANQLIEDISKIPSSSTARLYLQEANLIINGPFCPQLATKSAFLHAFRCSDIGLSCHILKIPANANHVVHELSIWEQVKEFGVDRFVPLEKIEFNNESYLEDIGGTVIKARSALLMPIYPATLQHPPFLSDATLLSIGHYVKQSLDSMHSKGYDHCDIKSPNLFLHTNGKVIIGDYGAAGPTGSELTETSRPYVAEEILFDGKRSHKLDFCMLATTLLEKRRKWERTTCTMAHIHTRINEIGHEQLKAFILSLLA